MLGKGFHGDCGACGERLAEELGIHLVHGSEIIHVGQIHRGLDHVAEVESRLLEYGLGIEDALPGLFFYSALWKLSRCRIDGQLARGKDKSTGANGLAVGANGLGSLRG